MAAVEAQLKVDTDAVIHEAMEKIREIQIEARNKMDASLANALTKIAIIKSASLSSGSYSRASVANVASSSKKHGFAKKLRNMLKL
jgi:hypothetical protein